MEKTQLLIVDDKAQNLLALESLIAGPQVDIFKAHSGIEALELLLDHDFALILMDVQMPGMDGFEAAELIRGRERTRHLPIIFVSAASREQQHVFRGYDSGAVDFLHKPLDPHIVRSKVRVFVELDQHRKELGRQLAQQKTLADEMRRLKETAESANRAKTAFLANVSHEIRTPMSAILGFAELMQDPDMHQDERLACVQTIMRNGKQLVAIVDDILDMSKAESGRISIDRTDVGLSQLVFEVTSLLRQQALNKGIGLEVKSQGPVPTTIKTDAVRLKQILTNIIGNAVKFTSRGAVEVTVRVHADSDGKNRLYFDVADSGEGIALEQAQKLFQPFVQADDSTRRRFGGTGLGLSLSRHLARALGGDVVLSESALGCGSVFTIMVDPGPLDEAKMREGLCEIPDASDAGTPFEGPRLDNVRVLVVEDAPDTRTLVRRLLNLAGASVETACDGREGIERAASGLFDVVLMDIQMPGIDGCEATKRLRQQGYAAPIIALTAHAMPEERALCLTAGCDDHLTKPINRRSLLELVAHYAIAHA